MADENEKNMFKFERKGLDFPFYNNIPKLSNLKWTILFLGFIATILFNFFLRPQSPHEITGLIYFLIPFSTFLYVANGKLGLICKKFQKKDVKFMIGIPFLYIISASLIGIILHYIGLTSNSNPAFGQLYSIIFWINYPFQIFGEELIKLIPFLIILFLVYKFTENRKIGIVIASLVSVLIFGLLHINSYGSIVHVIFIQGFCSLLFLYTYLKSKNIFISYIAHIVTDILIFIMGIFQGASFLFL